MQGRLICSQPINVITANVINQFMLSFSKCDRTDQNTPLYLMYEYVYLHIFIGRLMLSEFFCPKRIKLRNFQCNKKIYVYFLNVLLS